MANAQILVLGATADDGARLTQVLKDVGPLARVEAGYQGAARLHGELNPALVVVLATDLEPALEATTQLAQVGARVVVVGPRLDAQLVLRCLRAGAREFVVSGDDKDLRRAAGKLVSPSQDGIGSVVTVFPVKGGVGATCIATNLAGVLHRQGKRVCLLDLDLNFGDVLSFLDLPSKYSITDVIANMQRLDRDLLEASMTRHSSGIFILAQTDKLEEAEHVSVEEVQGLLTFLRKHFDWVVIDGVHGFDEVSLLALDESRRVLLTLTQDVPAVRNAQRCIELFKSLGYPDEKIELTLNRFQKNAKISPELITETTGLSIGAVVANDFDAVIRSINHGVMLVDEAPSSRMVRDFEELARVVTGAGAPPAKGGLFKNLFLRKAGAHGA